VAELLEQLNAERFDGHLHHVPKADPPPAPTPAPAVSPTASTSTTTSTSSPRDMTAAAAVKRLVELIFVGERYPALAGASSPSTMPLSPQVNAKHIQYSPIGRWESGRRSLQK